jgi:cytochrome c oxidase cbb3-type subunit II
MIRPLPRRGRALRPLLGRRRIVYDHPFQWGSKRTGPDLARVGGRYSDDWLKIHFNNPRDVVPESNMPAYPWLLTTPLYGGDVQTRMRALRSVGVPYTDADIAGAPAAGPGIQRSRRPGRLPAELGMQLRNVRD